MSEQRGKVFLLGGEGCGYGDSNLGFQILMDSLETLADRKDRPVAIICWNTAVRLVTKGSPAQSRLKRLEEKGVNVLAGRSCLIDLELEDKVAVGKVANMNDIMDLILHNDVISL
ncbi:MAG: hypothetical protein J7L78_01835 [Dehalococcoidales bacterium]|nr:hypothetical protein [Dehalococcoidales bacterium]